MLNQSNAPQGAIVLSSSSRPAKRPPYPHRVAVAHLSLLVISLATGGLAGAQALPAAAPAPGGPVISNLQPALGNVQTAISGVNIAHWKVPSEVRADAQQDVASMQRDLSTTLPGLMSQAQAAAASSGPAALSPAFAVFRNLDALYDVLLRVTGMASLAGSAADASSLEAARAGLEDGRAKLGAWLLQAIGAQDVKIANAVAVTPHSAPATQGPTKVVVDDGPETAKPHKRKPSAAQAPQ